jgi:CDP-diacylglycerol--glycerol-3-phosphate 3-phosphatidyltransferase
MSIVRIALVPFVGAALRAPDPAAARPTLLALLAVAFATDWFDGRIARWTRQESEWGRILDPVADKIFVLGVAVFLVLYRGFPAWLLGLLAARDLGILVCAGLLTRRIASVPRSSAIGRVAMCVFSLALLVYALPVPALRAPLAWASAAFVALSTASYARAFLALERGGVPHAGAASR